MLISSNIFNKYKEICDDFINDNFGVNCTLNYPTKKEICPNCIYNPQTQTSTNTYKSGGPIPFSNSFCPYCAGLGYKDVHESDSIKMRVYWTKKDWVKLQIPININDGAIQTIGFLTDLPKIKQAIEIIVNSDQSHYGEQKFVLAGEPVVHGLKRDRYFVAFWNRA